MDGILFKLFYQVSCVILLANGEGCKDMVFKVTFEGKTLANHVFKTIRSVNDGHCQLQCFLDDRCISYSFGTSASGEKYMCELSDSDHIMYPEDLVDRPDVIYRSAQNTCSCTKNMACRMNFVDGTHRCECKPGFQGVNCAANYTKIGCFQDADGTPNPFPRIIVNLRPEINWNDIKTSVVDKCANAAKTMGYKYFGIQFYGECWSGPDDKIDYDKDGPSQECSNGVGKEDTNFVYKLV